MCTNTAFFRFNKYPMAVVLLAFILASFYFCLECSVRELFYRFARPFSRGVYDLIKLADHGSNNDPEHKCNQCFT